MSEKYSARDIPEASAARATALACVALTLALTALSCLASCARKAPAAAGSTQGTAAAPPPAQLARPAPDSAAAQGGKAPSAAATVPRAAVVPRQIPRPTAPYAASIRGFGLRAASTPKIARDYSLGPLQSYRPSSPTESAILAAARAFMDALAAGKLDAKLLLPESRDALAVLLAPPSAAAGGQGAAAQGATTPYRLGAIAINGDDASLRVRLPGRVRASGTAVAEAPAASPAAPPAAPARADEGLLSLRKVGESWYIEALALDPIATGALAFDPSAGDR